MQNCVIIVVMMEENDGSFLAGGDALVYVTGQMHKKYSAIFVWGHPLTLFRMDFFSAAHRWGAKGGHTYTTMMKLGTVIPYLKKFQKIYQSRDTSLTFC